MINVTQLIPLFRAANQQAIIDTYNLGDKRYKEFFPTQYRTDLTFKSLSATVNSSVAAAVVGFDSASPRFSRPLPGSASGEIPKIQGSRTKNESTINIYRQLVQNFNQGLGGSDELIKYMYDDALFAVNAVNSRMEWLAKRAASTGKLTLTIANNQQGIVTKTDVDFGVAAGQRVNATTDWATSATADPIADIQARVDAARAKGYKFNWMFMNQETFTRFAKTAAVQKFAASFAQNALGTQLTPSQATVNNALREQGMPQIIVWDSYVTLEKKDGSQVSESGWEDGYVTFTETPQLGNTQYTTTADEFIDLGDVVKTKSDFILVKTWAEQNPTIIETEGVAYALPVLNNWSRINILRTKLS